MKYAVLRAFQYSPDGVRVVDLAAGSSEEIRADLVEGLKAAGFIGDPDAPAEPRIAAGILGQGALATVEPTSEGVTPSAGQEVDAPAEPFSPFRVAADETVEVRKPTSRKSRR